MRFKKRKVLLNRRIKKIIVSAVFFFCGASLFADVLVGGYPVCVSESLYEQFMSSYLAGDMKNCEYLARNGCFFPEKGVSVSVLEKSGLTSRAKIRLFFDGRALDMWTHYKNVRELEK